MPRVYQVCSAVVLVVSVILVWCTLAVRFAHHQERAGLRNIDRKQFASNAQHSRMGHNYSHPNSPPRHKNYRRDTPLTKHTRKIAAIGDLHSDYARTLSILKKAEVVNDDGHWSGKYDLLVQVGDVIDYGPNPIELFHYIEQLRTEARAASGNVLSLMGDHEFFAMAGVTLLSPKSDKDAFGGREERLRELTTGTIGGFLADHYEVALRIPFQAPLDNPNTPYDPNVVSRFSHSAIAFVHAGLSPENPYLTPFPTKMNDFGRFAKSMLQGQTYEWEKWLSGGGLVFGDDVHGPLWYKGWALLPEGYVCPQVDEVLQNTGTRRVIVGHMIVQEITRRCDGKLLLIDTGISSYFDKLGGIPSLLSIEYALHPVPESPQRPEQLWKETEVLTAIYVGRKDVELLTSVDTFSAKSA